MIFVEWIGCGMKIRADDPLAMKDFVQSVQNRASELKASSGEGKADINSFRVSCTCNFCDYRALCCYWINHWNADWVILAGGVHAWNHIWHQEQQKKA